MAKITLSQSGKKPKRQTRDSFRKNSHHCTIIPMAQRQLSTKKGWFFKQFIAWLSRVPLHFWVLPHTTERSKLKRLCAPPKWEWPVGCIKKLNVMPKINKNTLKKNKSSNSTRWTRNHWFFYPHKTQVNLICQKKSVFENIDTP